jgi:hypothetical protein
MDIERARGLFADLSRIAFERPGRDDPHHNLTDPLELAAIAAGIKPTFLGGQSGHVSPLLEEIASAASAHGLHARRSVGLSEAAEFSALGASKIDAGYLAHFLDWTLKNCKKDDEALWVYSDRSLEPAIVACERGERSASEVLGYPPCCLDWFIGLTARRLELKLQAYAREYGARSSAELIELERQDVGPSLRVRRMIDEVGDQITENLGNSLVAFPFIHFTACPTCVVTPESPAAKIHEKMRELALALDTAFAKRFEEYAAWYKENCMEGQT